MAAPKGNDTGYRWEKGKSGNPAGRPKADLEIRKYAGTFTREAVDKLVELMRGRYPKIALAAANALLDRAHGKPTQKLASDEDAGGFIVQVNMLPREPKSSPVTNLPIDE